MLFELSSRYLYSNNNANNNNDSPNNNDHIKPIL
jgi:hypothetical protein